MGGGRAGCGANEEVFSDGSLLLSRANSVQLERARAPSAWVCGRGGWISAMLSFLYSIFSMLSFLSCRRGSR